MSGNVLITGAGKGLGLYLTENILSKEQKVIALYKHKSKELEKLKEKFGQLLNLILVDVSDENSVKKAAEKTSSIVSSLDILINNAGVHLETPPPDIFEADIGAIKKTLSINAIGPLRITKHFLPMLLKGSKKLLINISSEAGSIEDAWRLREYGYCMSKAALNMQSKLLQNRLKEYGVKVMAIHPGWMKTEMGGMEADLNPEESAAAIVDIIESGWKLDGSIYLDWKKKPLRW